MMQRSGLGAWVLVAVAMHVGVVLAKDVATEQHAASEALQAMESARSQYQADLEQLKLQKQLLAQQQKQLAEAEKKAAASRKQYLEAQANYNKKRAVLDRAWGK